MAPPESPEPSLRAGYLLVPPKRFYYWLFDSAAPAADALIIWLNGGPGCSSLTGAAVEHGPFLLTPEGDKHRNPHAWNRHNHVAYIEFPYGTGFSRSSAKEAKDIPEKLTMEELCADFAAILRKFYEMNPNLKEFKLYIAGESAAGSFIPYVARHLLRSDHGGSGTQLRGIILGNAWIDTLRQTESVVTYSLMKDIISNKDAGPDSTLKVVAALLEKCQKAVARRGNSIYVPECDKVLETTLQSTTSKGKYCLNMYDVRLRDPTADGGCGLTWPPAMAGLYKFLSSSENRAAIKVSNDDANPWKECSSAVYDSVLKGAGTSESSVRIIAQLLQRPDRDMRVLIYAGDQDLSCNYIGVERALGLTTDRNALEINVSSNEFVAGNDGERNSWGTFSVDGLTIGSGYSDHEKGLTYVRVAGASHMVGVDRARELQELVEWFVAYDSKQGRTAAIETSERGFTERYLVHVGAVVAGVMLAAVIIVRRINRRRYSPVRSGDSVGRQAPGSPAGEVM